MADLEIRDTSGNVLVALTRAWIYPWTRGAQTNVAVAEAVGGKAYSARRGDTRLRIRVAFELMGPVQAGDLLSFFRQYAGGAGAFLLHLGGAWETKYDGSKKFDGTIVYAGDLRCRYYGAAPDVDETFFRRYRGACEFLQDLG